MADPVELASLAFVAGIFIPVLFYGVYWFTLDQAKRYADEQIRDVKTDLRKEIRDRDG